MTELMSAEKRLIRIFAAWDTYRAGYLSLEEFLAEFELHDEAVDAMAKRALEVSE